LSYGWRKPRFANISGPHIYHQLLFEKVYQPGRCSPAKALVLLICPENQALCVLCKSAEKYQGIKMRSGGGGLPSSHRLYAKSEKIIKGFEKNFEKI